MVPISEHLLLTVKSSIRKNIFEYNKHILFLFDDFWTLTFARTCYFAILDRAWGGGGGCHPRLICPPIEMELSHKDEQKAWDVLNLTMPNFTTLGHILSLPGQVNQKILPFGKINVHANNFFK